MSTLYVKFTPPSPAPSQYKIRYKKTTDPSYTELVVVATAPTPATEDFSITGVTSGVNYNVEVQSYCGDGVYSAGFAIISNPQTCVEWEADNLSGPTKTLNYVPCGSTLPTAQSILSGGSFTACAVGTPTGTAGLVITNSGIPCTP